MILNSFYDENTSLNNFLNLYIDAISCIDKNHLEWLIVHSIYYFDDIMNQLKGVWICDSETKLFIMIIWKSIYKFPFIFKY